jgi:hypothetical protein
MELAEMWMIDDLCTNIVASIEANTEGLNPAERIRFARRFSIPGWIPQAILALVSREQPLSATDMECLGYADAAKVSQLREAKKEIQVHELHDKFHPQMWDAWVPTCPCAACKWAENMVAKPDPSAGARAEHAQNLETKARLARMMDDYQTRLNVVSAQRSDELAKKREKAFRKIEEEKAKRRTAVLKERDEERLWLEEGERLAREEEERIAREEKGDYMQLVGRRLPLIAFFRASYRGGASLRRGGAPRSRGGNPRCCAQAARGGASRRRGRCPPADRARTGGCRLSCWWAQNAPPDGGGYAHPHIFTGRGAQCAAAFPRAYARRACIVVAPYIRRCHCPPSDLRWGEAGRRWHLARA